ncbi:hypothetical protein [Ekhidna sp.]|uniref:hypothetical protein n=1 Tax=Ekhidna sp. TaxID=2608089 RepID=UPI003B5C1539
MINLIQIAVGNLRNSVFIIGILFSSLVIGQRTVEAEIDTSFNYEFTPVNFEHNKVILVDMGHNTIYSSPSGRITSREMFRILDQDGFDVQFTQSQLDSAYLQSVRPDLLLLHGMPNDAIKLANDERTEYLYISPLRTEEVESIAKYVFNGGGLLVFLSHFPGGSGALPLMEAFGVKFRDGYSNQVDYHTSDGGICGHFLMDEKNRMLNKRHPVFTSSLDSTTLPKKVRFYCGAAVFRNPADVILPFPQGTINSTPTDGIDFIEETSSSYAGMIGFDYGKGRVVVCTDQGIFRSLDLLIKGERVAVTIHDPKADNAGLLINVIRWLTKLQ